MPATQHTQQTPQAIAILEEALENSAQTLLETEPVLSSWLATQQMSLADLRGAHMASAAQQVAHTLSTTQESQHTQLLQTLTIEEITAVIEKLTKLAQSAQAAKQTPDQLYLEQQLGDLLGCPVSSELEGHQLPHTSGVMNAEPHQKQHPNDTAPSYYTEAGFTTRRSMLGWDTAHSSQELPQANGEQYAVHIQLQYTLEWSLGQAQQQQLKQWYRLRKVVVVNPFELTAVIAQVQDFGPSERIQKQFGGSPAVIREGGIWSQKTSGKVLLFFVDDPSNTIPLGPVELVPKVLQTN